MHSLLAPSVQTCSHVHAQNDWQNLFTTLVSQVTLCFVMFLCRSTIELYGLWDQLRVDHGREFYLTLFIHEQIRRTCGSRAIVSYVQSTSKEVNLCMVHSVIIIATY